MSVVVVGLYAAKFVSGPAALDLFAVQLPTAAIAAATLAVGVVSYLRVPKHHLERATFLNYALLVITVASLVVSTGESNSVFIGLWVTVGVFAGVFGWPGFALILLLIALYDGYGLFFGSTAESIVVVSVASVAPLIASFIIWHSRSSKDTQQAIAYTELASELSHESNKSETVLSAVSDGVISVNQKGVIELINPAAQRIVGWKQSEAIGLSYKSVIKLKDKTGAVMTDANDPVERVLSSNQEVHSDDFSVETEAGKKVLLSLVISPVGGPGTGAIMVLRDVTKEKTEEREQAEFISTASHEMRTPVASIEGYLGLALNPATATIDEKARDYVTKAQASAQHLGRLFQDLLDVTKADDGRIKNNPNVINVAEFVGMVMEGLRPKAAAKGLRFVYKPTPAPNAPERNIQPVYYSHVDDDHLREIVSNLIENAIKYTPAGDVIVDVSGTDQTVTISIQDSGIGIPKEDIPHLFQKFYRVDNTDTREIGGTGLGLYLCRRLAEIMGGHVRLESEYKKGSTFFVDIPRIDHLEAQRLMEAATARAELASSLESSVKPALASSTVSTPSTYAATNPPQVATAQQTITQPATQPLGQAPVPQPQNVPLTQIEKDPGAYLSTRPSVQVPPRNS